MTVENLPVFFLILAGAGVMIILIGIIMLASGQDETYYTKFEKENEANNLEELFSYFLQEEEKKNQDLREMMIESAKSSVNLKNIKNKKIQQPDSEIFHQIIKMSQEGESPEEIARKLKKGIGEVKLVLSLYTMR